MSDLVRNQNVGFLRLRLNIRLLQAAKYIAASHLGLFCLPMSHKKDARLIWVNKMKLVNNTHFLFRMLHIKPIYVIFYTIYIIFSIFDYIFRHYVLYRIPRLKFLDSSPVKSCDLEEAKRVGPFMKMVRGSEDNVCISYQLSWVVRKPVIGVSDQVQHKLGCTTTEDG